MSGGGTARFEHMQLRESTCACGAPFRYLHAASHVWSTRHKHWRIIREWFMAGYPVKEIASQLGTHASMVSLVAHELGCPRRKQRTGIRHGLSHRQYDRLYHRLIRATPPKKFVVIPGKRLSCPISRKIARELAGSKNQYARRSQ